MMNYFDWQQAREKALNEALEQVERSARAAMDAKMYTSLDLQLHNLAYLERAFKNLVVAIGYTPEEISRYDGWKQEAIKARVAEMKTILDKWDLLEWKPFNFDDEERS